MLENYRGDFVEYALRYFQILNWKPANPKDCDAPWIVAYGNVNDMGCGCACVIDPKAKLFKIELAQRSANEVVRSQCVVKYENDKMAIARFEHYMDKTGLFHKEAWLGGE